MTNRSVRHGKFRSKLAQIILKILGWQVKYSHPESAKYVLVAAPHTSNWDLPYMLLVSMVAGVRLNWVAKDTLFKGWFGSYLRWLGGIPVNRRNKSNFTQQVVEIFNNSSQMIIVIAPEGTRSKAEKWRSGFYHIALGANVPIAMGYLDYRNKIGGVGPSFFPSGNLQKDILILREFYKNISGRNTNNMSHVHL